VERDGQPGELSPSTARAVLRAALPPLLYVALAVALFHSAWAAPMSTTVGGHGDADASIWYHAWTPYALSHGHDPLLTDHLNFPGGANLMWQTSQPLLGLLSWPVATLGSHYLAYDVVMTLGLALSAWCAYVVFRRWIAWRPAAFAGGLVYGFSPYMAAHALGHANLVVAFVPPLILGVLDEIVVRQRRSAVRAGLLLGALATVQFYVAEELLATEAIVALAAVVVLALLHRDRARMHVDHALRALGAAAVVTAVFCGPALAVQFLGPDRLGGQFQHPGGYSSDLLNFVVPTSVQQVVPGAATRIVHHFTGNTSEQTGYLGLPLVLILAYTVWRFRGVAWVRVVALLGVIAALLSMGPTLHVDGHATHIPLPWVVFEHLPVLANIVPGRLMLYVFLMAGLLLALFVEQLRRIASVPAARSLATGGALALALALVALLPTFDFGFAPHSDPPFFTAGGDVQRIPDGATALVAPFAARGDQVETEVWQVAANFRFRMPSGYVLLPNPAGGDHLIGPQLRPLSQAMIDIALGHTAPVLTAALRAQMQDDLRYWQTSVVIVGPMLHQEVMVQFLGDLLGAAPQQDQGVDVWWSTGL
jgi:hypothetical protein